MGTLEDRLAAKSMRTSCGCVIWLGSTDPKGYGRLHNPKGSRHAHRIAYELARGPIPKGMELDHLCRISSCVNPDHLEPVTRKENIRRGVVSEVNKSNRHFCKLGHELTDENTYLYDPGDGYMRRRCKKCNTLEQRRRRVSRP